MGSTRQTFSQDRHAGQLPATDPSDYNLTTNSIWPVGIRIKQTEDIWTIWNPPNCYNNTKRKHKIRWKTGKIFFLQHFLIISSTEATFLLLSFSKTILLSRSEESWTSEYYLQSGD